MKKRILLVMVLAGILCLSACTNQTLEDAKTAVDEYNTELAEYSQKIAPYNEAVGKLEEANQSIEDAIDQAQAVIDKGEEPFDPETLTTLKETMAEADKAKVAIPDRLPEYESMKVDEEAKNDALKDLTKKANEDKEAMESCKIPETPQIPDVSGTVKKMNKARGKYEDSIQGLKQITAPSDDFIKDRIQKIKSITSIMAVTEDHDPNGLLNKQGGYIGCTYYTDKRVDRSELYIEDGKDNPIDVGTEGGGAIEVFNTKEEAEARDSYLSGFDAFAGGSGSHRVYGTIIIRTSQHLKASLQEEMTEKILKKLLKVEK